MVLPLLLAPKWVSHSVRFGEEITTRLSGTASGGIFHPHSPDLVP
eukprot:SAG11_NODE_22092_length_412_cov_1.309904_2_plen_44_part_01